MLDEIKKGLFASFGAVLLTRGKIDEVSRKLVQETKLSKEDAQKLAKELVETGENQWQELETTVTQNVRKGLEALGVSNKQAIEALEKRVASLEKRITVLEMSPSGNESESTSSAE
jgi:polyhydroxyalkanoate synthesis regulator phasin